MTCITRFAPSPTGFLHIGNARTALINFLYAKQRNGKFILRIDDTDIARCQIKFLLAIFQDLSWLQCNWNQIFNQLEKKERHKNVLDDLIAEGLVYPCYETREELEENRAKQIKSSKPPIYDRASLRLTQKQIGQFQKEGRVPHYRFLINSAHTSEWQDLIRGKLIFENKSLSDPVVLREDGTITYLLSSVIDDIDSDITDIIRGEDHISNTAIQLQFFAALKAKIPNFGHLSLLHTPNGKISKREGGEEIRALRRDFLAFAVNSFMTFLGTSKPIQIYKTMEELVTNFDITTYSKSQTCYHEDELAKINAKAIRSLDYESIKSLMFNRDTHLNENCEAYTPQSALHAIESLSETNLEKDYDKSDEMMETLTSSLWSKIKFNVNNLSDVRLWCQIVTKDPINENKALDANYLMLAADSLPLEINENTASVWIEKLQALTQKKGKELFLPIRLALTGYTHGPTLSDLLLVLDRKTVINRLKNLN